MDYTAWNNFVKARESFRNTVEDLSLSLPNLKGIQQKFANSRGENCAYTVETPVVYNTALDDITNKDKVKLILVADNPGRREQAAENRRYLVGPSGKIAGKFFRDNPSLGIDFQKNVIILNKTPVHSPRTVELRELCRMETANGQLTAALENSQRTMAELLINFHETLECPVWITGYSEMRKNGIFEVYTESLKKLYADKKDLYKQLFVFRHFSMNQFTIDLKQQALPGESVAKSLKRIGAAYRDRILYM
ncbi:MAG: hypothetical protein LBC80_00350 [Treponema sp.]|jgi:predicted O-linked N-acetylglucosamine transferase (SPINDLY family)|nr:hypothetical protein [Treponema sp.]